MKALIKISVAVVIIISLGFLWLFFLISRTARIDNAEKADAIAVLGAAAYWGVPSPVFKARLDHAYELFQKNLATIIITTGGIYSGEILAEGDVGKKYLKEKGVPEEKIIAEAFSTTTQQNIMRISEIAENKGFRKIILVSDPFHMYRAIKIAEDFDLEAFSSPTRSSPISQNKLVEFQYVLREIISVMLSRLYHLSVITTSFV